MMDDLEPLPEDAERWARNLMKPSESRLDSDAAIIAKVLGTKTQAEEFLRHERRPSSRIDIRRPFKSRPPIIRFEYWEATTGSARGWHIERFENGKRMGVRSGDDWKKRDDLLIKLQAAGMTCTPITVAGVIPQPIKGRMRDCRKQPSSRFEIISQIGKLTTDDLEDYD